MTVRTVAIAIAATALLVSTAGACEEAPTVPGPSQEEGTIPAANATEAPLLPTYADTLPEMDAATFERLMGQLEGTPVLLNFWGEWCPPCREEMPLLVAAHAEWGDRVQFLGIDILDSRGAARSFMEEFEMTFPSVFDPPDSIKNSLGLFGQPVTAFYRADGSLEFAWSGPISEDLLRTHLERIAG
jgi:cytochrome c biogenesis protein CcmG, thiol:disulfide interchange protein DsbE